LTFSRSETNWNWCEQLLKTGCNVSALFSEKLPLPKTYKGFKVVDGDSSDIVMMKHKGVILGLRAKGKAKKDQTGFVIKDLNN